MATKTTNKEINEEITNDANTNTNTATDPKAMMREFVKTQVESELGESLDKVEEMKDAQITLRGDIKEMEDRIANMKAIQKEKAIQLNEVNSFLFKYSDEGLNKLIDQRLDAMFAAMNGENLKSSKTRTNTRSRTSNPTKLDGYTITYAIDGKPRSFLTKHHLTNRLSNKLGHSVGIQDVINAFVADTGIEPYSEQHKDAGTLTADIEGLQVTITLTASE